MRGSSRRRLSTVSETPERGLGVAQTRAEIEETARALESRFARERTQPRVTEVVPSIEPLPPVWEDAMHWARDWAEHSARRQDMHWQSQALPFFRGFHIQTAADFWQTFFYRLVNPASRSGEKMNAAERLRQGKARFAPSTYQVFFYSPRPAEPDAGSVSETRLSRPAP